MTGLFINELGYEPVVYWGQSTVEIILANSGSMML